MFLSRIGFGWALAVVVLAAALVPAAGATARGIVPSSPWYAYDAALRNAQHQQHATTNIQPTSPWYAYDAALRNAHQRSSTPPPTSSRRVPGTRTTPHSGTHTSGSSTPPPTSSRRVPGTHTAPHSGTHSTSGSIESSKSFRSSGSAKRILTDTLG